MTTSDRYGGFYKGPPRPDLIEIALLAMVFIVALLLAEFGPDLIEWTYK